ncbi:hypothetical protein EsH8_XV_000022 [Colletotrichum jinshuiense]
MPSFGDCNGIRSNTLKLEPSKSVSSKDLLKFWDSDGEDDAATGSTTKTTTAHRPACSEAHHGSSPETVIPRKPDRTVPFQKQTQARLVTPASLAGSGRVEASAQQLATTELMVSNDTPLSRVQLAKDSADGPIRWLMTWPSVLIRIMLSAAGWLLRNPMTAARLGISCALLMVVAWVLCKTAKTVQLSLEAFFWFKSYLSMVFRNSALVEPAVMMTAAAGQDAVRGQQQQDKYSHRPSYAPLQEPGLILPRIDTSFHVTIGHVKSLLAEVVAPQAMVGFASQLTPMAESWAKAMKDWSSLRPEWMQSVGGFLGMLTQHSDTLAMLDQQWAEEDDQHADEMARWKASSWPVRLYWSVTEWLALALGEERDMPVWTERHKNDMAIMHARAARDAVTSHCRNAKRYIKSFSSLQEQLSSTVEPACVTKWLRKPSILSVRVVTAADGVTLANTGLDNADENISDATVSLRALCTMVKEARAELGRLKGQLEKDQMLLLRQADVLSEQVNTLVRISTSETETRILRESICKLQRDVHNIYGRHRTLYNLLNVDRRASRVEIMEALQKVHEELRPGMQPCWTALDETGRDAAVIHPFEHLPGVCADPVFVGLQTDLNLANRAADILWTLPSRSKYDGEVLHSFAVLARIEDVEREAGNEGQSSSSGGGDLVSQLRQKKKAQAQSDRELWGLCEEYVKE